MKRKKHKKRKVWPIILVVLTVLIVMAAAAVFLFRTRSYKVEGNSYYGERTITTWIENDPLSVNSLYVLYKYNFTDADLPSGVESLSISLKDPWTVKVKVKEKEMAGYVDYDGAYLYFDRTGTAVLRTKKIIEGVPHIEGLMFDSAKAKIGKKLPVEDDSIFEKIVEVSKNLKKYNLTPVWMGLRRRSSCVFRYWSTTVFIPLTANNSPAHIGLIWIDGRKRMRRSATSMTALFLSRRSWISIVLRAGRIAAAGSAEVSASAVH